MKILQIGTIDNVGGAAKLSFSIKQELDRRSIQNWVATNSKTENEERIIKINKKNTFFEKVLNKTLHTDGMFKKTYSDLKQLPFWKEIDIIHLHNIHGNYFNILDLPKISKEKKVLWTLHDPWLLTNKTKFVPEYKNIFSNENIIVNRLKNKAVRETNVVMISPSKWLSDKVKVEYPEKKVEIIHNGVDTNTFTQKSKTASRKILNLPINKKIVLSVSNGGKKNTGKGTYFLNSIEKDDDFKNTLFLSLGDKDHYVKDREMLSLYYSASDLLLYPSLADNSPLVIMESMSCGTPVVAFNTGGIPEIIDHTESGYIAKYKDLDDLVKGVWFILNHPDKNKLGNDARKKIVEDFNIDNMIDNYISLYKSTLNI